MKKVERTSEHEEHLYDLMTFMVKHWERYRKFDIPLLVELKVTILDLLALRQIYVEDKEVEDNKAMNKLMDQIVEMTKNNESDRIELLQKHFNISETEAKNWLDNLNKPVKDEEVYRLDTDKMSIGIGKLSVDPEGIKIPTKDEWNKQRVDALLKVVSFGFSKDEYVKRELIIELHELLGDGLYGEDKF